MRVTELTKRRLAYVRMYHDLIPKGWEEIGERGGRLWELYRGARYDHKIVDVKIAPGGKSLFVKIEK